MAALIQCPSCQKEYRWKPELAGKRVKCKCGTVISVPAQEPAAEQNDLYDLADDGPAAKGGGGLADLQAAAAAAPVAVDEGNQMRCPYCGEGIDPGAAMCVFCGSNLKAGGAKGAKKRPVASALESAPPSAARPVKMRDPSPEDNEGKKKLIIIAVLAVVVVVGAVFGLKHLAPKGAADDPNLKPEDKRIIAKIDEENGKEAREWLKANDQRMIGKWSAKQSLYHIDEFYNEMGAKKVIAFGAIYSTTIAVELPDDPAKRKLIFDWAAKWHKEQHIKADVDEGQKWMEIQIPIG